MNSEDILIRPIGFVNSSFKSAKDIRTAYKEEKASLIEAVVGVKKEWTGCLEGIEEFSHAWILFHIHKADRTELKTHPMGNKKIPEYGIFATRSQYRPNHIGLRLVEILEVGVDFLKVKGLDAIDNTPVIDIKPYIRKHDSADNPKEPGWRHIR